MRRFAVFLGLLLLFLLEGTLMEWVIPDSWQNRVMIAPHLVLTGVVLAAIFINRYQGLAYALFFGFLQDFIYYGHALGVYSFCMGLVGYLSGSLLRRAHKGIAVSLMAVAIASLAYDSLLYAIYYFFLRVTTVDFEWMFLHFILPSMLFNTLLATLLYVPARKWLEFSVISRETEEN